MVQTYGLTHIDLAVRETWDDTRRIRTASAQRKGALCDVRKMLRDI